MARRAGSVASALKFYTKQEFVRGAGNPAPQRNDKLYQGIGYRELFKSAILAGLPGMTENVVREQLASLKASEIIAEPIYPVP